MYNKTLFTVTLTVGTLIAIASYSWMGMWIGLEINLLSFIPLMTDAKNKMATEAALKYFITQALASTLLLFSLILMSMDLTTSAMVGLGLKLITNTSLLTKMGAAPFHFWFPEVIEGLSWTNSAILLIWQKIAPMALIMFFNITQTYLTLVVITCMMVSGLMGMNQTSLRKILAYSSINHIGWMLSAMWFSETLWILYFLVYSVITASILLIFSSLNIFFLAQLPNAIAYDLPIKLFTMLNFMSLGGLPPFLGFFPKWITIQTLVSSKFFLVSTLMVVMTLLTLYFYIRVVFSAILLGANEMNFHHQRKINKFLMFTLSVVSIVGLVLSTALFNYL
uniref:NADH-ubiquinone oxidoreductase chain 2 n=1 Tax=Cheirotonus jansoni TaxID=1297118 RepID=V9MHC6_9SCAR|nr:NADH dehydrogenase subunit 2 [Cheirotonus jansoni]AGG19628.1 NADH dehydrogenase subunit 2 [Cheirotonus jansoni]